MDFSFIPKKAKENVLSLESEAEPVLSIRGSGAFNSQPGESYLMAYPDKIYMMDRGFGDNDYSIRVVKYSDIENISFSKENFSSQLDIQFNGAPLLIQISYAESDNCSKLIELASISHVSETAEATSVMGTDTYTETNDALSPLAALAVALIFVASEDGDIQDIEHQMILKICSDDADIFNSAAEYYNSHSYEEFINSLKLNEQQKLCFYTNMLEMAMTDGVLASVEQKLINNFAEYMKITPDACDKTWTVLLAKNQLSVL